MARLEPASMSGGQEDGPCHGHMGSGTAFGASGGPDSNWGAPQSRGAWTQAQFRQGFWKARRFGSQAAAGLRTQPRSATFLSAPMTQRTLVTSSSDLVVRTAGNAWLLMSSGLRCARRACSRRVPLDAEPDRRLSIGALSLVLACLIKRGVRACDQLCERVIWL